MNNLAFFKGKKVFLTGHTGFKGSWLSRILIFFHRDPVANPFCAHLDRSSHIFRAVAFTCMDRKRDTQCSRLRKQVCKL